jgi:hypothetical protein
MGSVRLVSMLGGPFESIPVELLQSLAAQVQKISSCSNVPILTLLSQYCDVVDFSTYSGPLDLIAFCLRRMNAGVCQVILPRIKQDNELLVALAESPAAATLRKMQFLFANASLTDASSTAWKHFPSLEKVSVVSMLLTWKTVDEILKLPKLRKLRMDSERISGTHLIDKVIQMDLQLDYLSCEVPDQQIQPEVEKVVEMLRKNPEFAARLRVLELSNATYSNLDGTKIWIDLQQVCPNLTRPPIIIQFRNRRISHTLPRFRSVFAEESCITQHDVDILAARCTELETLQLRAKHFQADDLRGFHRLRSFTLDVDTTFPANIQFPSTLTTLQLDAHFKSDCELDAMLRRISSTLPALEDLTFHCGEKIETSTYLHLLTSLPNLCWLKRTCSDTSEGPLIEVNHPNLTSIPESHKSGFSHLPGSLPKLEDLFLNFTDQNIKLGAGNALRLPGIRNLFLCTRNWNIAFARHLKLLDVLELSGEVGDLLPENVLELDCLMRISLDGYSLGESFCSSLIQKATRLQSLSLRTTGKVTPDDEIRSLDWIAHPILQHLTLYNLGDSMEPGRVLPFVLDATKLPFLTEVSLSFRTNVDLPPAFNVSSLSRLRSFHLVNACIKQAEPTVLVLSGCPHLLKIDIAGVELKGLVLVDLLRLESLEINGCRISFESSLEALRVETELFKFSSMPSLRKLSIVESRREEGQAELVAALRDRIVRVAPSSLLMTTASRFENTL